MERKEQIKKLKTILKDLKSLPAHDMAIGGAIYCVTMALQHLKEHNHKPKIVKG